MSRWHRWAVRVYWTSIGLIVGWFIWALFLGPDISESCQLEIDTRNGPTWLLVLGWGLFAASRLAIAMEKDRRPRRRDG